MLALTIHDLGIAPPRGMWNVTMKMETEFENIPNIPDDSNHSISAFVIIIEVIIARARVIVMW